MIKTPLGNFLTTACLLVFVSLTSCKQSEQKQPDRDSHQRNIPIKVAIIYNFGGAQAVASEHFHLLNKDFVHIWKQASLVNEKELKKRGVNLNDEQLFRLGFLSDNLRVLDKEPSKLAEAVKPYVVKEVTTDFEGNATFENVPEGEYYIYGITETRSGYAVWNYKVSTNESKTVLLDNKNAIYSW